MRGQWTLCPVLFLVVLLPGGARSEGRNSDGSSSSSAAVGIRAFLGRWDLTIKTPAQERPSWIELSEEGGLPEGLMVGFWGHATPTGKVQIKNAKVEFLAPPDEGFSDGTEFTGKLVRGELVGRATNPKGVSWRWTGRRAPALNRKVVLRWGKPIRLFDGKDLAGWRFSDPRRAAVWSVEDGTLVKDGSGSELITDSRFEDFKLHVEFNCGPMANSGVYLRGRYEVQIESNSASAPPDQRMGGVYGFLTPHPALARTPSVWQSYNITLIGRTVTVIHDGRTVIARREIPGITGGALDSHEGLPGPIYLQGSEEGRVAFRNILLTPAK